MPILFEEHEFHTIDIYEFQWGELVTLEQVKNAFENQGGVVIAHEGYPEWTKAVILSEENSLSWADAEAIANALAVKYPGGLWTWMVHSDKLYGYTKSLWTISGVAIAGVTGLAIGFML